MGEFKLYKYVGPPEIAKSVNLSSSRTEVTCGGDVMRLTSGRSLTFTFIIDSQRTLWIADRQSEHVACARGGPVLSAGEITFEVSDGKAIATYITNQSTGYCPEPVSWSAVASALDRAGIEHYGRFDLACEFRRCDCGQINIVKDGVFECAVCGGELCKLWNFAN